MNTLTETERRLPKAARRELRELHEGLLCEGCSVRPLLCEDMLPVVEAYLRTGDVARRSTLFGMTLLHLACSELRAALVPCLLQQGADPNAERPSWQPAVPDGTSLDAASPLSLAVERANFIPDDEEALERLGPVVSALLAAGADVRRPYQDGSGKTVEEALRVRSPRVAARLEGQGITLSQPSRRGQ